jgi:multiple sugar transport system substrate-binding protein
MFTVVDTTQNRRDFLKVSLAASGSLLAGGVLSACGSSGTSAGGKPKQMRLLYATVEADSAAVKAVVPAYRKAFGIDLAVDTIPYDALQQKVFSEMASGGSTYDIMICDAPWMPALVGKFQPLGDYIKNPKLNDMAKIDLTDFIPKVFYDTVVYKASNSHLHYPDATASADAAAIQAKGFEIYGLPIQANALTMSYRKDLFDDPKEQAAFKQQTGQDLAVPQTWDDFRTVAKFFTRPDQKLWGTTMMAGVGDWATDDFKTLLACWGGDGHLVSDDFKLSFAGPQGVQALQYYVDLINTDKVTPRGTTSASWDTVTSTFGAGLTAMSFNYHDMALDSNVDGQVSYATVPKQVAEGPHFGTWQLSIPKAARNKEWAYRSIAWLTSADVQRQMLAKQLHPTRTSVYAAAAGDATAKKDFGNFYEILGKSLAAGVGRARLTNYSDISNAVGVAVNKAASKSLTPEAALQAAAKEAQAALKRAGYA